MSMTALVTGGSHNIGQGIAIVLAKKGYDVAITYHKRQDGAEDTRRTVEALGRKCFVFQADLEVEDGPQRAVDNAYRALGHLDLVVCNAGRDTRGSVLTVTSDDLNALFESNYRNYILTAGAAARYMVRDNIHGNIVFITSSRSQRAYPDDFLYGGFKAAIMRACESIALDLSYYNIRVNCIAPGCVWPKSNWCPDPDSVPFLRESVPMHRTGTPEDIGEAVAYIASDAAGYVTGVTLRVDGGLILPGLREGNDPVYWYRPEWHDETKDKALRMLEEHERSL